MSVSKLGVVIVTYDCADVIVDCLESLVTAFAAQDIRVAVVDNASTDDTVERVQTWANLGHPTSTDLPFALPFAPKPIALEHLKDDPAQTEPVPGATPLTLIETGRNGGFAFGVNRGIRALLSDPEVGAVWVLNPDSVVPAQTAAALAKSLAEHPDFGLMGGRIRYLEEPDLIQSDNGQIEFWTGRTRNLNLGKTISQAQPVKADDFDFVAGASLIVSRAYAEKIGLMHEGFFLYYEEVDWALRGKDFPRIYNPEIEVYHRAGASIGSHTTTRVASSFSSYFLYRARMMFVRRHNPVAIPLAAGFALLKGAQMMLKGNWRLGLAIWRGILQLPPPQEVRQRLSPAAMAIAFNHKAIQ